MSIPESSPRPPDAQSVVFPAQHVDALLDRACGAYTRSHLPLCPVHSAVALPAPTSHRLLGVVIDLRILQPRAAWCAALPRGLSLSGALISPLLVPLRLVLLAVGDISFNALGSIKVHIKAPRGGERKQYIRVTLSLLIPKP